MKNDYIVRGSDAAIIIDKDGGKIEAIISTTDLEKAKEFPNTWFYAKYVQGQLRQNGKTMTVYLHRWITEAAIKTYVDHSDHDTLNNRRNNLRNGSQSLNMQNRKDAQVNNKSSGKRGVYWDKKLQKWRVKVEVNDVQHHIGYFSDLSDAVKASQKARKELMPFSKERKGVI